MKTSDSRFKGHYSRQGGGLQQCLAVSAIALILSGCGSVKIPLPSLAALDKPANAQTQDAGSDVVVQEPLPETLAYSDATAIGSVAVDDVLDTITTAGAAEGVGWENGQTGSTGTVVPLSEISQDGDETCRSFGATVISMLGIHRYFGKACRHSQGVVVKSIKAANAKAG